MSNPITALLEDSRSVLKWLLFTGLAVAFAVGAWATTLRADVNRALSSLSTSEVMARQLDSVRIELRHVTEAQKEIKELLLKGR